LAEMLNQTDEQTLLQIFVPQEKVMKSPIFLVLGFPAHPKSIERAERLFRQECFQVHQELVQ